MSTIERSTLVDGLRELADFIEQHPRFERALEFQQFLLPVQDADEFASLITELGGQRTKDASDKYLNVGRTFGGIGIRVFIARDEVCEQVQVGVATVEREEIITPAVTTTVTVTEPVMEWRCRPLLGGVVD